MHAPGSSAFAHVTAFSTQNDSSSEVWQVDAVGHWASLVQARVQNVLLPCQDAQTFSRQYGCSATTQVKLVLVVLESQVAAMRFENGHSP